MLVALAACGSSAHTLSFPPGTPAWVRADATRLATSLGDPHPTAVRIKPGLYTVIAVTGKFTCNSCSRPPSASSPTGTVAAITVDRNTHQSPSFALCHDTSGFCGICNQGDCSLARYALDTALAELSRRTRGRGEVKFSRYPGFYRKCGLKDPAAEYGVISGNCHVSERVEPAHIVVKLTETWHALDRSGRRTDKGPLRRHQWGIVVGRDGRVHGFWSTGSPPPQFES